MDGSHLGQFVDYFQEIMNQKNTAETLFTSENLDFNLK
jgi:hypothetical protein